MATKKQGDNYYQNRNRRNLQKLSEIIEDSLPEFCYDYFAGIDSLTSPLTRMNYANDLKIFFYYLTTHKYRGKSVKDITLSDLESVTSGDIEFFLGFLSNYEYNGQTHSCSDCAKARKLSSVRAMFKYFFNRGLISVNNASKVSTPKLHEKPIIRLDGDEVSNIIDVAETGDGLTVRQRAYHERDKIRDTAILTLFLGTGIRISELVGLNNDSINFKDNSFIVTRKGGSQSILYFDDDVAAALKLYMDYKDDVGLKNEPSSPLFLSAGSNNRLTARAVENLVQKYAKIVSPLKHITPHKLRSTYGTALYKATGDIYVVADVLGHKDVNTTRKHYAAISDETRKSVVGKVKLHKDGDNKDDDKLNDDESD